MTETVIFELADTIDVVFLAISVAILLIELVEAAFKRSYLGRTLAEMLVSASTQMPYLLVEAVMLTSGYALFYILAELVAPWQMETTVWTLALAVLVADFFYYWEHRIAHEVRLLWTQHAVHHSSRDYNIITAVRFGPFEGLWSVLAHLPMVFLGFAPEAIFFGVITVLAYQTWLHTELIGQLGVLERFMNTPSHHRVHHGADDKYLDKNYAGILIIWDRMFGTFQIEEETPRYGLKRDFDSRNPIAVWFSEWPALIRDIRGARSWGEAWRFLMRPPGWRPSADGRE